MNERDIIVECAVKDIANVLFRYRQEGSVSETDIAKAIVRAILALAPAVSPAVDSSPAPAKRLPDQEALADDAAVLHNVRYLVNVAHRQNATFTFDEMAAVLRCMSAAVERSPAPAHTADAMERARTVLDRMSPAREPVTLDEQIAAVQERIDLLDAAASMVHRGLRHAFEQSGGSEAWRAVRATLQQHKHAMAVVEATRKYRAAQADFKKYTEADAKDASYELNYALAAFDAASPKTETNDG